MSFFANFHSTLKKKTDMSGIKAVVKKIPYWKRFKKKKKSFCEKTVVWINDDWDSVAQSNLKKNEKSE